MKQSKSNTKKTATKSYGMNTKDLDWQEEMLLEAKNAQDTDTWEKDQETPNWSFDVDDWTML